MYNKVDSPYEYTLTKNTYTKGDIKVVYDLEYYYEKILPDYSTITSLPEENANYIKEALPNVTSCNSMLAYCNELISVDTTGWDTSKITNMYCMFYECYTLTNLDVSKWDTSKVTNMDSMFYLCGELISLDVSNWNTSNVTDMGNMFNNCSSLTTITGVIDMKSCTSYGDMFTSCDKLTGVKIKNPPSGFNGGGLSSSQYTIVS